MINDNTLNESSLFSIVDSTLGSCSIIQKGIQSDSKKYNNKINTIKKGLEKLKFSDNSLIFKNETEKLQYSVLIDDYLNHLDESERKYIKSYLYNVDTQQKFTYLKEYIHRHSKKYIQKKIAYLYRLDSWYNSLPRDKKLVSMLTLTTSQRGKSHFYQFNELRDNYIKLMDLLRHNFDNLNYVSVWESHKSGYAHIHILVFGIKLTYSDIEHYKQIWASKYGLGSVPNALTVETRKVGTIKSTVNYVMKYLTKTLTVDKDTPLNQLLFNSVVWLMSKRDNDMKGIRTFQPSRKLSQIMNNDYDKSTNLICYKIELELDNSETYTIYDKEIDVLLADYYKSRLKDLSGLEF